ncbi:MAG: hypothetical protein WBQ40_10370 [Candidatus Sulfotelmatobacter sp.]
MIQPLRTVHRRTFMALAFILPAILVVGLRARPPHVRPAFHFSDLPAGAYMVRESGGLWRKHAIQSMFYSMPDRPQDIYVALQPTQEFNEPDLLLYWTASVPQGSALPVDAHLVGAYTAGKTFLLPMNEKRSGYLILFSLAHQMVFDTGTVEKLP